MHRILPLLFLFAAHALAEELSVKPGINDKFLDPALKVEEWTEKFATERREIFHQRNQIVASVGLKPGMKIADSAVMLAKRGHAVHLSTTDPAAHVAQTLAGQVNGLTLSKIDPATETAAYQAEVLRAQGAAMDEAARPLLEEDQRSPATSG